MQSPPPRNQSLESERARVRQTLAGAAHDRAAQWLPVNVARLPDPDKLTEYTLLGAHSYALVETRRRLIKEKIIIEPGIAETPSAIARDYLRLEYKHGPKGTHRQLEHVAGIPPVPCYAKPGHFLQGYYIDIQAAYWSIMQIIGWDVDYNPGLWLSPGRPPSSFPFDDHKVARNCLVSAGRMTGIPTYNPKKLPGDPYLELTKGNVLKNMQLPRLIHDLLNSVAALCIDEGAIYANNDGVIAPSSAIADRCTQIMADWGLVGRVKYEGPGEVKAYGTYMIGTYGTRTYDRKRQEQPIAHVYAPPYAKWLLKEFSFFAGKGIE